MATTLSDEIIKLVNAANSDGIISKEENVLIEETLKRAHRLDVITTILGFLIGIAALGLGALVALDVKISDSSKYVFIVSALGGGSYLGSKIGTYTPGSFKLASMESIQQQNKVLRAVVDKTLGNTSA